MKKQITKILTVAFGAIILGAFVSCGEVNTTEPDYNAGGAEITSLIVRATYNSSTKYFKGSFSGTSITIDLPSNIDSWDDVTLEVGGIMAKGSIQLNGTGTSYDYDAAQSITGVSILDITSILANGFTDGYTYTDQTYTLTINKKLYVSYSPNYTGYVPNWWTSVVPSSNSVVLYNAGDKISLPAEEAERSNYRHLGWSTSSSAESPEYNLGDEITVTESMVTSGVLDVYATWSKYYIGQLLEGVTDIDGNTQTGYVAYICSANDSLRASSSKTDESWTYLIVSKYGAARLTDVAWDSATFTDAYLPAKAEMEVIIENLWETSSTRQWKIFSDGSQTSSSWDYYWTATADDADSSKAYYASVTTCSGVTGTYSGIVVSSQSKENSLKAIGVSYIE